MSENHLRAPIQWQAALVALPALMDHLGLQFPCGYLRDQLVRKDRLTSDFAGVSGAAARGQLNTLITSFKSQHPKLAMELTRQRIKSKKKLSSARSINHLKAPQTADLTNRTLLIYLTLGLACRGVGGTNGHSVRPCDSSTIFEYPLLTAFERDHWP